MARKRLTLKEELFCRNYVTDLNATRAYMDAGYKGKEKTAAPNASRMLDKPHIQEFISKLLKERRERLGVDADYVLHRLVEIDQMDVADILDEDMSIKPLSEWPASWRRYLTGFSLEDLYEGRGDDKKMIGILKKIKWPDKVKNLELLGKHIGVQAFKDKTELSGPNGGPINQVHYTPDDYARAQAELEGKLQGLD